jgi:threonylcarbamoyladenosine tRNA methylthiotransferase CDKAL1
MQVFVKSFGCSTNHADGAVLAGCLCHAAYTIVDSISNADVVIYNTCAVKGPTEDRVVAVLKSVPSNKKLVVVGCLPLINRRRIEEGVRFDGLAGPAVGEGIVNIVDQVVKGERVVAVEEHFRNKPELNLPRMDLNPTVSVIPICYGCLGSCAYCCVVFARGYLRSCRVEEIVQRVEDDLGKGFREFWLTAQDVGCYGKDIGVNLAQLLESICTVEGDFKVRVGMMTPGSAVDELEELAMAFEDEKIFKFLHLPVQSGDDEVLDRMRRPYSVRDFKKVVGRFSASYPRMTLATDVICGFPGESSEAFKGTLSLIEQVRPDVVNVSKFYVRPGTPATKMQGSFVSSYEIKWRSKQAGLLAKKIVSEKNKQWVGWKGSVLVDEVGKVGGSWVGRNFAYRPIVVKSAEPLLGKTVIVEVVRSFHTFLEGKMVE